MKGKRIGLLFLCCLLLSPAVRGQKIERHRAAANGGAEELFWAPNIIGMGTVETLAAGNLNVTIMHNFGILTDRTLQDFFGFDVPPNVRLGIDYGITKNWSVGIGRSTFDKVVDFRTCLLYTSPSPRDGLLSRMPSSA